MFSVDFFLCGKKMLLFGTEIDNCPKQIYGTVVAKEKLF